MLPNGLVIAVLAAVPLSGATGTTEVRTTLFDTGDRNYLVNPALAEQEGGVPRGWSVDGRFTYERMFSP
jgi:hypothetical protein